MGPNPYSASALCSHSYARSIMEISYQLQCDVGYKQLIYTSGKKKQCIFKIAV